MSLQAKIEAVIYASEEPVTLQQLVGLLGDEAGAELDRVASVQVELDLEQEPAGSEQETGSPLSVEETATSEEALPEVAVGQADAAEPTDADKRRARERERAIRDHIRRAADSLIREYAESDRGIEIREVASGFRMATKPEYHDAVRGFVKSLKPALKLTLPALETLAVVAYKQPVTAAEISEIRGVDTSGVLGGLLTRKLIATAGRKQVIGRPMLYKTTRDFLLRFGLKDVGELPSMDEFERMAGELVEQEDLPMEGTDVLIEWANARGDAEHIREMTAETDDTDESDDTLQAEAAALSSNNENAHATAETAAGGNDGRHNEPAAAAPLHTTEADDAAAKQADEPTSGQAATGEEGERDREH